MSNELNIRPRIRMTAPVDPDVLAASLMEYFRDNRTQYFGFVVKHHAVVEMHWDNAAFWTPRLEADLEEHEKGTLIRGLMAPRPGVWGFLMALYGFFGFSAFFSMIMGLSSWTLDKFPWQLLITAGCLVGILVVYLVAQGGKRIVSKEMAEMKAYFVEALGQGAEEEA